MRTRPALGLVTSLGLLFALGVLFALGACSNSGTPVSDSHPTGDAGIERAMATGPNVVATTSLVGNVASVVGGEGIHLTVLLPQGGDPHTYEPTPADAAAITQADLVLINGLGLEESLEPLLAGVDFETRVVSVSDGIETIAFGQHLGSDVRNGGDTTQQQGHDVDPHVWFDPANVAIWADNIAAALGETDPQRAQQYESRAAWYRAELARLDEWISDQVAPLPAERRRLVSDHRVLGYFARRYGFEQVGAARPGISTLSEPSAAEVADLERSIVELGVPAVFVGTTANPILAERIAQDTGVNVVTLYTGSLSAQGGPANTYLDFMRHDVTAIVEALK